MNLLTELAAAAHTEDLPFWEEVWGIVLDPAHIVAELTWNIIFDVLFVSVLYGIVFKRLMLPRLRREIHREIDEEHGIEPHDEIDHTDHKH